MFPAFPRFSLLYHITYIYIYIYIPDELYIEKVKIKKIDNFCYLGSILGPSNKEIAKRTSNGRMVIGILNSALWSKNIINRTKQLIYKSILESIVLYGSEVWTMNRQHANRLTTVEMDFWRRAARKSRIERIQNAEIRRMMHAERTIMDEIEHRRLKWYRHLQRMKDGRMEN